MCNIAYICCGSNYTKKRRATAVRHQGSPQAHLQTECPYEYRRFSTVGIMLVFIRGGDSDDVEQIFQNVCNRTSPIVVANITQTIKPKC